MNDPRKSFSSCYMLHMYNAQLGYEVIFSNMLTSYSEMFSKHNLNYMNLQKSYAFHHESLPQRWVPHTGITWPMLFMVSWRQEKKRDINNISCIGFIKLINTEEIWQLILTIKSITLWKIETTLKNRSEGISFWFC